MRILNYSPYNIWELHGQWDMTIMHSLYLRGAEIKYIMCDGLFSECDVFWHCVQPRTESSCRFCQVKVANFAMQMQMPYEWLGRYLLPEEFREARRWADQLAVSELRNAEYNDWKICEWMQSSVHSHLRMSDLDLNDPFIQQICRNHAYSGLVAGFGLSRLLEYFKPDVFFLFNGRQSSTRVALEIALEKGIRVICHERGMLSESIRLTENEHCVGLKDYKKYLHEWNDIPLNRRELQTITEYMNGRQYGKNLGWDMYSPLPQNLDELYQQLKLNPECPIWVMFTSTEDEIVAHLDEWAGVFQQGFDWIHQTIQFVKKYPDIQLVIRVHPGTGGEKATGKNLQELQKYKELQQQIPPNVRIVLPDDEISSYSLMDMATLGLVYVSTVGLEMACKGKTVICAGQSFYTSVPIVKTVQSMTQYASMLEEMRKLPLKAVSKEIQQLAYRCAYTVFYKLSIPFPYVQMPDAHTGVLTYTTTDALLPGREPNLDNICHILLENKPVCALPSADDMLRLETDERLWFDMPPHLPESEKIKRQQIEQALQTMPITVSHSSQVAQLFCSQQQAKKPPFAPKVSVIIPCYNYGQYLSDAVHSILHQSFTDYEIIIVNDGSPDDSEDIAKRLIAAYPETRIYLLSQPNAGQPAIARNNGIQLAKGKYILCLDADDQVSFNFLEACTQVLDDNPLISIAFPHQRNTQNENAFHARPEYNFENITLFNFIPTASLYRRQAWEEVGGYKTNVIGYEDWEFWINCGEHGHFGNIAHNATFYYRVHGSSSLINQQKDKDQELKARIIEHHPKLYTETQKQWAKLILEDPSKVEKESNWTVMPVFDTYKPETTRILQAMYADIQSADGNRVGQNLIQLFLLQRNYTSEEKIHLLSSNPTRLLKKLSDRPDKEAFILDISPRQNEHLLTENMESAAQIWVPSESARQWLIQGSEGLKDKVHVIPYYIPQVYFNFKKESKETIEITEKAFKFLSIFSLENALWEDLLFAYMQTFTANDDVAYVLFIQNTPMEQVQDTLSTWLEEHHYDGDDSAELVLLDFEEIKHDLALVYASVNAYIAIPYPDPTGEWLLKALTFELPVIGSPQIMKSFTLDHLQLPTQEYEQESLWIQKYVKQTPQLQIYKSNQDFGHQWNQKSIEKTQHLLSLPSVTG